MFKKYVLIDFLRNPDQMEDRSRAEETHDWHEEILGTDDSELYHPTRVLSNPPEGLFIERVAGKVVVAGYTCPKSRNIKYFLIVDNCGRKTARACDANGIPLDEMRHDLGQYFREVKANLRLLANAKDPRTIGQKFVRLVREEPEA